MGHTFGSSLVVEGSDVFTLPDHTKSLFGDIHVRHNILPFVFFANQEFVFGSKRNSAAFANEPNESHIAL